MQGTETERYDVERLYVGSLHTSSIEYDWGSGYTEGGEQRWQSFEAPSCPECDAYARWDEEENTWVCRSAPGECENAGGEVDPFDNGAEGPMMNYYYPLEDLGRASDVYDAAERIRDLPLCVVDFDESGGGYALALTGGGMDLSWEICEAFTRLGFLPPLHFCDLPRMSGYPRGEPDLYVIEACKRSAEVARYQAERTAERLAEFTA